MIRQLTHRDQEEVMSFLKKESEINLFIIGDIENYGFDQDFQKLWGEYKEDDQLIAVLLKYHGNFIFYSRDHYDVKGFYDILMKEDFVMLSGEEAIIEKFEALHSFSKKTTSYFAKLNHNSKLKEHPLLDRVRKVKVEDITSILELSNGIEEFGRNYTRRLLERELVDKTARGFLIKEMDEAIAMAKTTAENSTSAMVVGVCTKNGYRRKGYASACMTALCREVLSEGKSLCLFYHNPDAGRIYKALGFKDIGMWVMYDK